MNTGANTSTRDSELTPFKRLAHALVDDLPANATWQDLAAQIRFEIELEEAVTEAGKAFEKPKIGGSEDLAPALQP